MSLSALPKDRDGLRERWQNGERFQFHFFYGHKPPAKGVDSSCFSQWFARAFVVDGISYLTAEHWMMAEKARLFGDESMLGSILASETPKEAKALGRKVGGFDPSVWDEHKFQIVCAGNLEKFKQHEDFREYLLATSPAILVEAAGRDVIWGIGLGAANAKAQDPAQWRGRNLLGFALTQVREKLAQ